MAPVRISSGPEPIMTLDLSSSSLVLYLMMFGQNSSSLVLHQMTFVQISSNLASQMSQRRLLASLQAPFLKDKKVVKWINVDQLIGKGNLLLDLQKLQKNPIFRISVDIRQNTNYVRAFTTSANVPSIYILLFWNTLTHDAKTGVYSFQVDEHWLTLSADLLRKALNRWIIASQDETTGPSVHPEDATSTKMVRETLSHADTEFGGNSEKINSETNTEILNIGDKQALSIENGSSIEGRVLFKFNVWVPIGKCNRVLERQKKLRNQIFRALTASADVPSSVTETTDTTSTLQPPRPPLQTYSSSRYLVER
ncbi:hypothetical protein Tco_1173052 [Tanacetum coccineum]